MTKLLRVWVFIISGLELRMTFVFSKSLKPKLRMTPNQANLWEFYSWSKTGDHFGTCFSTTSQGYIGKNPPFSHRHFSNVDRSESFIWYCYLVGGASLNTPYTCEATKTKAAEELFLICVVPNLAKFYHSISLFLDFVTWHCAHMRTRWGALDEKFQLQICTFLLNPRLRRALEGQKLSRSQAGISAWRLWSFMESEVWKTRFWTSLTWTASALVAELNWIFDWAVSSKSLWVFGCMQHAWC